MRKFLEYCATKGFTAEEGKKLYAIYVKHKTIRVDVYHGTFHIVDGIFLDVETMRHILETN